MFTNKIQQYLSWSYFHLVGLDVLLSAKFSGIASAQKIEELISPGAPTIAGLSQGDAGERTPCGATLVLLPP